MSWINLLSIVYPIGSIYMSFSNMSPASIVGGTWSQIENRFLYCSNDTTTGGENSFTKDFNHNHFMSIESQNNNPWLYSLNHSGFGCHDGDAAVPIKPVVTSESKYMDNVNYYGPAPDYGRSTGVPLGEVEFNNMPAYQSIYCWRRTA